MKPTDYRPLASAISAFSLVAMQSAFAAVAEVDAKAAAPHAVAKTNDGDAGTIPNIRAEVSSPDVSAAAETVRQQAPASAPAVLSDELKARFSLITNVDPLLKSLAAWCANNWQSEQPQLFVYSGNEFITADGGTAASWGPAVPAYLAEYGCTHVIAKRFTRPQRSVNIYIYSFPTVEGAYGAYSLMHTGSSNVLPHGDMSSEDENSISIWQGHRFVVMQSTADEDEVSKGLISKLADELSVQIGEHGRLPSLMNQLPILDQVKGSARYLMGPLAVRKQVPVPFVSQLAVEKSRGAAFAQYQIAPPDAERMQAIIIDYGDTRIAHDVYAGYAAALANSHKTTQLNENAELVKLPHSYLFCRQIGSRIMIVAGAKRKSSPLMIARQLAY